ncbi:hypothetical protein D3C81_1027940 [compost metagenome]
MVPACSTGGAPSPAGTGSVGSAGRNSPGAVRNTVATGVCAFTAISIGTSESRAMTVVAPASFSS